MKLAEHFGLDNEALQEHMDCQQDLKWDREADEALVRKEEEDSRGESGHNI